MTSLPNELIQWAQEYGAAGLSLLVLIESAGVPFPCELSFIAARGLIRGGHATWWVVYTLFVTAQFAGSAVGYYLGRLGDSALSRRLTRGRAVARAHQRLRGWYARYGLLAIFAGRLIGQVRPFSSLVAGMAGVPPAIFWAITTAGVLAYTAAALWLAEVGWDLWGKYPALRVPGLLLLVLLFCVPLLYGLVRALLGRRADRP